MPWSEGFSTGFSACPALVAQGIEHRFPKPGVAGSNPAGGTKRHPKRAKRRSPACGVGCRFPDGKNTFQMVRLITDRKGNYPMRFDSPIDDLFLNRSHVRILRALLRLPEGLPASGREIARRAGVTH